MTPMKVYKKCIELLESGRNVALVTVIKASRGTPGKEGFKMLVADNGELFGTGGGGALEHHTIEEAKKVLQEEKNEILQLDLSTLGMKCGGRTTVTVEYLKGARSFVLFGGGHVGRALAPILKSLGFRLTVFDNREEVRDQLKESLLERVIITDYNDLSGHRQTVEQARYCFIATHGHDYDYAVLKQILTLSDHYDYVGLIGSRNKVRTIVERLRSEGLSAPEYLFASVGINLGGDTAAEIAVSVAAEVIARLHGTPVEHMRIMGESSPS